MHFIVKNIAFLLLCGNTTGTSYGRPEGLPSVAKEVGVWGQSHHKKTKNYYYILSIIPPSLIIYFLSA